jgi:chromosomal replication initiation ATPase DnaA
MTNIKQAQKAIKNKWDWENPSNNLPIFLFGPIGLGKTHIVYELAAERMIYELKKYNGPNKDRAEQELNRFLIRCKSWICF